jgi:membrane-associated phospholipid phosphatase
MGFWFLSRRLAAFLLLLVTVLICLPRLILGYHYPTDLIVGALIGFGTVYVVYAYVNIGSLSKMTNLWEQRSAGTLYVCFFIVTYLIATLLEPLRTMAKFLRSIAATLT